MSYVSMANRYSVYSSLLSSTYSTGAMPSGVSGSLLNTYSYIYGAGSSGSYGTNTVTSSSKTKNYVVDLKEKSADLLSTLNSLKQKGSTSPFADSIKGQSDNKAVSVSYKGSEMPDEFTVDVSQTAAAQENKGSALKSNASSLYYTDDTSISITSGEKSVSFSYNAKITETDSKAMKNIAEKINEAEIGVTASVVTDSKSGTSTLVLKADKTGEDNGFTVTGGLAESLGVNNVTTEGRDAIYFIDGEKRTSSSNEIKLDNNAVLTLNDTTEKTANVSFKKDNLKAINAARELVNGFNALANTAYKFDDKGSAALGRQLKSAASTYRSSLSKIGISLNKKGYLEIDEEKMQKAADSGELDKFFNIGGKQNMNYGFNYRVETIAKSVNSDPTKYLSNDAKTDLKNTNTASSYNFSNANVSRNYISSYYRYSSMSLLFNALI